MMNWDKAPEEVRGGLQRYVENRIQPGDFLTAVLENDLKESMGRADATNRRQLLEIVTFLYWEVPASCWGSPEKVRAWLEGGKR